MGVTKGTGRWWLNKARQLGRHLLGKVSVSERAALAAWLTPRQLELFERMHRADQRHGLDVVRALRAAGHSDPELLLAGLLHDSGKHAWVGVWHRVGWSLAERYGSAMRRAWTLLPGFGRAFESLDGHAERSAELALAAGCSPRVGELIRHQSDPAGDPLGEALRFADEAS
jgi:hypothetical protein